MKNGGLLEYLNEAPLQVENLNWYANCTVPTSNIHITYLVLAHQKLLNNG